jgi:ADP-ribose pyrophosphatase YjhB (NUDIX family)
VVREVHEETGLDCTVGDVLDVGSTHFEGTAPSGRREDFHALQIVFAAEVSDGEPAVLDVGGTTDAVAWVPVVRLGSEEHPVRDLVHTALAAGRNRLDE